MYALMVNIVALGAALFNSIVNVQSPSAVEREAYEQDMFITRTRMTSLLSRKVWYLSN
jgi:hypothetical protein